MKCPQCGYECSDNGRFCKKCGTRLDEAEGSATVEPEPEKEKPSPVQSKPAEHEENTAGKHPAKGFFSGPQRNARIGAVAAIAVIVIALVGFFATEGPREQKALARDAIQNSEELTEGFVSNDFTEESPYSISDFNVTADVQMDQESRHALELAYGAKDIAACSCTGTAANESFQTTFGAYVYLCHDNGRWEVLGTPNFTRHNTVPLKGVTRPDEQSDSTEDNRLGSHAENLQSSFDADALTSETTSDLVVDYWYGSQTTRNSKSRYVFDSDTGWLFEGTPEHGAIKTNWDLAGKTFTYSDDETTSSITFDKVSGDKVNASYKLKYETDPDSFYQEYKPFSISGKLKGTLNNNYDGTFSVNLVDPKDNAMEFDCTSGTKTEDGEITNCELHAAVYTDKGNNNDLFSHDYSNNLTYSMPAPDYEGADDEEEEA